MQICVYILQEEGMVNNVPQTNWTTGSFFFFPLYTGQYPPELIFLKAWLGRPCTFFDRISMTRMILNRQRTHEI